MARSLGLQADNYGNVGVKVRCFASRDDRNQIEKGGQSAAAQSQISVINATEVPNAAHDYSYVSAQSIP